MANAAATDIGIPSNPLDDLNAALESKLAFQSFEAKQKARAELPWALAKSRPVGLV